MEAKTERYRRVRGLILKLLAYEHPGGLDLKVLHYSLDNLGYTIPEDELRSHLEYLGQKTPSLVKLENRKTGKIEIEMVVITSAGLDVLDAFTNDRGIDVRY
jgi:hypothetical protein